MLGSSCIHTLLDCCLHVSLVYPLVYSCFCLCMPLSTQDARRVRGSPLQYSPSTSPKHEVGPDRSGWIELVSIPMLWRVGGRSPRSEPSTIVQDRPDGSGNREKRKGTRAMHHQGCCELRWRATKPAPDFLLFSSDPFFHHRFSVPTLTNCDFAQRRSSFAQFSMSLIWSEGLRYCTMQPFLAYWSARPLLFLDSFPA